MQLKEIPRVVWALAAGRFLTSASTFLMLFLTLYLTGPRDLAVPVAGLLAGGYGVGLLVGNLTGGRWGDRLGHRRVLLACSTATGLGVMAIPWQPVWLLAPALLCGVAAVCAAGVVLLSGRASQAPRTQAGTRS